VFLRNILARIIGFILNNGVLFVPFLASGIPYVQFDRFIVDGNIFDFEIDPDGRQEGLVENVL
jgi:hypothetical protein